MEIQVGTHFFVSESSYTNLSYYEKQEKILRTILLGKYGNPATLIVWIVQFYLYLRICVVMNPERFHQSGACRDESPEKLLTLES